MNTLSGRCYGLSVCVAAITLASCNGAQPPIGAANAIPKSTATIWHDSMRREVLRSRNFYKRCGFDGSEAIWSVDASGKASGAWPGTFTADAILTSSKYRSSFKESFTITSGSETISGTAQWYGSVDFVRHNPCGGYGNDQLTYTIGSLSGRARFLVTDGSRKVRKKFEETLYRV